MLNVRAILTEQAAGVELSQTRTLIVLLPAPRALVLTVVLLNAALLAGVLMVVKLVHVPAVPLNWYWMVKVCPASGSVTVPLTVIVFPAAQAFAAGVDRVMVGVVLGGTIAPGALTVPQVTLMLDEIHITGNNPRSLDVEFQPIEIDVPPYKAHVCTLTGALSKKAERNQG